MIILVDIEIDINRTQSYTFSKEVTAPEGTGSLRRIIPDHFLRNVDDDHTITGDDRQTETVRTALGYDHKDPFTSCRDGSECTEKVRCHGALGLPAFSALFCNTTP